MSFTQIKRIKEIDRTAADAIESYGSFVGFLNAVAARVKQSKRRGWTPDRISLSRGNASVPVIHKAIHDKFGADTLHLAVNTHPFD